MQCLEDRLTRLEQTVGASRDVRQQVESLEQKVDALLVKYNAKHLDFDRLTAISRAQQQSIGAPHKLPQGDLQSASSANTKLSREAKIKIIEAQAADVLAQTANIVDLPLPHLECVDTSSVENQLQRCVHEFDETTQRSIQLARIYLEELNKVPKKSAKA